MKEAKELESMALDIIVGAHYVKNDSAEACFFCRNFRLVPGEGIGKFECENKNTADALKTCINFEPRELTKAESFEINILK